VVSTDYKRLFLRGIKWDAEDARPALRLEAALKAAARAQLTPTKGGVVLTGTAGNNHSVTFSLPAAGQGASPHQIAILCEELIKLYEDSKAALIASGVETPSDDQLLTEILDRLQPIKSLGPTSFLGLRCA
jgi:hypothetical protein